MTQPPPDNPVLTATFGTDSPSWYGDGVARGLSDLPQGTGPLIATVTVGDESPDSVVRPATVDVADMTVFRLAGNDNSPAQDHTDSQVVPVAGMRQTGSDSLAAGLGAHSLPAVFQALVDDVVLVPVTPGPDGQMVTRVFTADEGTALCVFSSAQTLESFYGGDGERLFIIMHGAAVVEYATGHLDQIRTLVFDPAGPASMMLPLADLAEFLAAADTIDVEDGGADEDMVPELEPGGTVVGFDVGLDSQWAVIPTSDPQLWDQRIGRVVDQQTRTMGDNAVLLRQDMRAWLGRVVRRAAEAGGSEVGFLVAHTRRAATALSVVTYCHALGFEVAGVSHLDRIEQTLVGKATPDEVFVRIDTPAGPVLRHSRVKPGDSSIGGGKVLLLLADYWLEAADREHVGHVSFTSPHVDAQPMILKLADNIVLNGQWVFDAAVLADGQTR